jgi:crossover junction endodeoxyribonuclease RuvC
VRILGVDPGSSCTGYGVIDKEKELLKVVNFGAIKLNSQDSFPHRLKKIKHEIVKLIQNFRPQVLVIEGLFYAKNVKSALKLGHVRGVILLAAIEEELEIFEYSPLEVKSAVVGYGRAEKSQVQQMVKNLLQLKEIPQPSDAADALALAICHAHSEKIRKELK